jgi:hypothetical protein
MAAPPKKLRPLHISPLKMPAVLPLDGEALVTPDAACADCVALPSAGCVVLPSADVQVSEILDSSPVGAPFESLGREDAVINICEGPKAKDLFCPEPDESVVECLSRRILFCEQQAAGNVSSKIAFKYIILRRAYVVALAHFPAFENWYDCCKIALGDCREMGIDVPRSFRTIATWNIYLHKHGTLAPIRSPKRRDEPLLFAVYPDAKVQIHRYFSANMETVTIEKFPDFLETGCFPLLISAENKKRDEDN